MVPEVVAHATADVTHEVVAAHIVRAPAKIAAIVVVRIETNALAADTRLEIRPDLLAEPRLKHRIEVIIDRAVG